MTGKTKFSLLNKLFKIRFYGLTRLTLYPCFELLEIRLGDHHQPHSTSSCSVKTASVPQQSQTINFNSINFSVIQSVPFSILKRASKVIVLLTVR